MIHMKFDRILQDPPHTSSIDNEYYRYLKHLILIPFDHGEKTKHRNIIQLQFGMDERVELTGRVRDNVE